MKDICQALFEYLSSREEIVRQVGTRIYPILLPQDAPFPSIVYAPVLCNYDSALQGDTGYVRQTIQIVCHARTFKLARELSRDVKRSLQGFSRRYVRVAHTSRVHKIGLRVRCEHFAQILNGRVHDEH